MAATIALCYPAPMKPFTVPSAFTTTFTQLSQTEDVAGVFSVP